MARPAGVRNQDFEEKRLALLRKVTGYLLRDDVIRPSFRQLAIAADTSEPTLRHYFQSRSGLIVAVLELIYQETDSFRNVLREPQDSPEQAVKGYLDYVQELAASERYVQMHAMGIRESREDDDIKETYLTKCVEPGVEALADRFVNSVGMPDDLETAKAAARMIISSSLAMTLHQEVLDGRKHVPIDKADFFGRVGDWVLHGLVKKD